MSKADAPPMVAVVTGASGITGSHCVQRLCGSPDFQQIVSLSRRELDLEGISDKVKQVHVDLGDKGKLDQGLSSLGATLQEGKARVYIFHCAYVSTGDPFKDCEANRGMLENTVEAVEAAGGSIAHVFTMQGTKYYGQQFLAPLKTPFDETDPRHIGPNFYFDLEDYLRSRVKSGAQFTWSALRPNPVCGFSSGSYMNLVVSIAVYASICKELGLALRFPGPETAYRGVMELCDADLLADAMLFTATTPAPGNQAFNINNGDLFRWEYIWPAIADWFGLAVTPPMKIDLPGAMKGQKAIWVDMVKRHGLRDIPYEKLATWEFFSFVVQMPEHGWFSNTTKLRKAGFQGMVVDSKEMLLSQFQMLREKKIIP